MTGFVPLHNGVVAEPSLPLLALITLAGMGAAVLLGLGLAAFMRRQSRPYLLIVGALAALLGRSTVAGITMSGLLAPTEHHVVEHGLDVVLVGLVIAAVYYARTVTQPTDAHS